MKAQNLICAVASAHHDLPAVVDIAGNGIDLIPVIAAEVRDGRLVIIASKKASDAPPVQSASMGEPASPTLTTAEAPKRRGRPPSPKLDGDTLE